MASTVECDIIHLREFLENCLCKKILDYSLRPLTNPGDNYGSIIQALKVTVISNNNCDRKSVRTFRFFFLEILKMHYQLSLLKYFFAVGTRRIRIGSENSSHRRIFGVNLFTRDYLCQRECILFEIYSGDAAITN